MKTKLLIVCFIILMAMGSMATDAKAGHRLGVGAHYWTVLKDIDRDLVDEDGLSWILSYQYLPNKFIKLEGQVEMLPENYGGSNDSVIAPQLFILFGTGLYAGIGAGQYVTGDNTDEDERLPTGARRGREVSP